MAGLDHPVHESTIGSDRYEACQKKVRKAGYWAPNRQYVADGRWIDRQVWIEDHSSKPCRYDLSHKDPKCSDCVSVGIGKFYDDDIRRRGT